MKLAIFTESIFHLSQGGRLYSPICQFIPFIVPLSEKFEKLTIASRHKKNVIPPNDINYIDFNERREFVGLPYYKSSEDFYIRSLYLVPKCLPILKRVINVNDVILLRIHHPMAAIIARISKNRGKPFVLYWAGPLITDLIRQNYPGRSIRGCAAKMIGKLHQNSYRNLARHASMNLFIDASEYKTMGSPEKTRWVVPNLVSEGDLTNQVKPRNDKILKVVFVGRLYRHKGIYDLLEAIKYLLQDNIQVKLHIVGDGPERENLENIVKKFVLSEHIIFYGNLAHAAVQKLMAQSHVMALPSYAEGLPKVLWEAWAKCLAVVMTDVGSISYYVKDQYNGLIVKAGKAGDLANAIKLLERDDEFRIKLAERGHVLAMEHTWKNEIENIAYAINEVACS